MEGKQKFLFKQLNSAIAFLNRSIINEFAYFLLTVINSINLIEYPSVEHLRNAQLLGFDERG
jgi:hypothetical protein